MFSGKEILLLALSTTIALIAISYLTGRDEGGCTIILSGHNAVLEGTSCSLLSPDVIKAMSAHLVGLRFSA